MRADTKHKNITIKKDGLRKLENSLRGSLFCRIFRHSYKPLIKEEPRGDQVCRICGYIDKREYREPPFDRSKMNIPYGAYHE